MCARTSVDKRNPCQSIASGIDPVILSYWGLDVYQFEDGRQHQASDPETVHG
jgi:hypothetical protein